MKSLALFHSSTTWGSGSNGTESSDQTGDRAERRGRRTASDPKRRYGDPQRPHTQSPHHVSSGLRAKRWDGINRGGPNFRTRNPNYFDARMLNYARNAIQPLMKRPPADFLSRGVGCSVRPRRARRSEPKRRRYCAGVSPTLRRNRRPKKLVSSANLLRDHFDQQLLGLQHLLGLLEPKRMHIFQRQQARCLDEAPNEGAFRQTRQLCHRPDRHNAPRPTPGTWRSIHRSPAG